MARIIGRLGSVGIGVEGTRGTGVAADFWVPLQGYDYDDKVAYAKNDSGLGNIAENNESDIISEWAEGSYDGKVFDTSIGAEFTALFGQAPVSTEIGSTDVFNHVYNLANNNQHKSLSLGYKDSNENLRYALAMMDSFSMEGALENYLKRTVNFKSKKASTVSNSVAYTEENEFIPSYIEFIMADDTSGLDAAQGIGIRSFTLDINKNVEVLYNLGSLEPLDIVNKQFAITGKFEAYFDSTTYKTWANTGVRKALRIEITNPTVIGSSGSNTPKIKIDMDKIKFESHERAWDLNEVMLQTVNFEAFYDINSGKIITATLTNEHDGSNYS